MQNSLDKCTAARNRVAAGKRASWPFSQPRKKGFDGFASFVTKRILWNTGKTEPAY